MRSHSLQQTAVVRKTVNMQQPAIPRLSEDAFYLLALASLLKKMLGPASLLHFLGLGQFLRWSERAS